MPEKDTNSDYLIAAGRWLELRLLRKIHERSVPGTMQLTMVSPAAHPALPPPTTATVSSMTAAPQRFAFWPFGRHKPAPPPQPLDPDSEQTLAFKQMQLAEKASPEPRLVRLARQLGLPDYDRYLLLLAVAIELQPAFGDHCAAIHGDPAMRYPTFWLAKKVFGGERELLNRALGGAGRVGEESLNDDDWLAMLAHRPLRYFRLLEIDQPGSRQLADAALRADEHITSYVIGYPGSEGRIDDLLARYIAPARSESVNLPASHEIKLDALRQLLGTDAPAIDPPAGPTPLAQLIGRDRDAKLLLAARAAQPAAPPQVPLSGGSGVMREQVNGDSKAPSAAPRLYRLPAHLMPTHSADVETLARLWERESLLQDIVLYVDAHDMDPGATGSAPGSDSVVAVTRLIADRGRGKMILGANDPWPQLPRDPLPIDVPKPAAIERRRAWMDQGIPGDIADELAPQFELSVASIVRIARSVPLSERRDPRLKDRLWDLCREHVRPKIDMLAQRIIPKAKKDHLVLPELQQRQLDALEEQVRCRGIVYDTWHFRDRMNRGLGISAIFAGESGTGKTMAAEVLADILQLDLYRIDLSAVVNKYIGETEKNLRRLFDAAEEGGVILFFDEADALFTRRTDVKDSHDRYANIEVNYLLQRMEAYTGLAILATNAKNLLDPAFLRRLRFVVDFPFLSESDRATIWEKAFPKERVERLDYARLKKFRLSGGNIQSVALNAAFRAAKAGERAKITMAHILPAIRDEFVKLERPINEADFRVPDPAKSKETAKPVEIS